MGRLRSAFIITRAIPDATGLIEFMSQRCPAASGAANAQSRRAVLRQLAEMTRAIHQAGFFHNDLYWRNILVSLEKNRPPLVWWIDCPRGQFDRWSPWRRRRLLKDLAGLDKCGSRYCTRSERLDFAKTYLDKKSLDADIRFLVGRAEAETAGNDRFELQIAFNYGGRDEIVRAARKIAEEAKAGRLNPAALDEAAFAAMLDTARAPDPEIVIRTSGEKRISNFLLWQSAYSEWVFLDVLWPDFDAAHFSAAIAEFERRERRFGGVAAAG